MIAGVFAAALHTLTHTERERVREERRLLQYSAWPLLAFRIKAR